MLSTFADAFRAAANLFCSVLISDWADESCTERSSILDSRLATSVSRSFSFFCRVLLCCPRALCADSSSFRDWISLFEAEQMLIEMSVH